MRYNNIAYDVEDVPNDLLPVPGTLRAGDALPRFMNQSVPDANMSYLRAPQRKILAQSGRGSIAKIILYIRTE